jgi:hypothetical protein
VPFRFNPCRPCCNQPQCTCPFWVSLNWEQRPGLKFRIFGQLGQDPASTCKTLSQAGVVFNGPTVFGVSLCSSSGTFDGVFDVSTFYPGPNQTSGDSTVLAGDGVCTLPPTGLTIYNYPPTISSFVITPDQSTPGFYTFSGVADDDAAHGADLFVTVTAAGFGLPGAIVNADGTWSTGGFGFPIPASGQKATAIIGDWYGLTGSGTATFQ